MVHRRRNEAGLTLIELMTALFISALVTVQVLAMMSATKESYYAQKRVLETQIDARLIADMVMRDLRGSGFMVPAMAGISSRDGALVGPDALCTSDSAVDETKLTEAVQPLNGAPLMVTLASTDTVQVADNEKDLDRDGDEDFVVGAGIIVSDGTRTHCARIVSLGSNSIKFTPATPAGFTAAVPNARAIPAVIYEITANGLMRNAILLSSNVEDFQVEFAVDTTGDGIIDPGAGEFPIHDLNATGTTAIRGVQLSVLSRTSLADPNINTPGRPAVANRTASGTADFFLRRLVTVTAAPRNLL